MSKQEQIALANELNTFYTGFDGSVDDPGNGAGGDGDGVDGMADGDSDDGHGGTNGDGGSAPTDYSQFTPIAVDEVSRLFLCVKLAKACGPDHIYA